MKTALALLPIGLVLAAPAHAKTVLNLSNTATVSAQPDELDATLRAEANAPTAAAAQDAVNRAIARALEAAKSAAGIHVETGRYSVWENRSEKPPAPAAPWHASQAVELRGSDGGAVLALVGTLQKQGLAVEQLGWRLSDGASHAAHEAALKKAITGLRGRADAIAAMLGLRFARFRTVHVGAPTPEPPRPLQMRAMVAGAGFAPPSAQSGPVTVSATVSAEAVLLAR